MNRLAVSVVLSSLLLGCADCPSLVGGTYRMTMNEVSGDCGPIEPSILTVPPGALPVLGVNQDECTGFVDVAEDGCFASFNRVCPGPMSSTVRLDGFSEAVSATSANIEFTVQVTGSEEACRSSYIGMAALLE